MIFDSVYHENKPIFLKGDHMKITKQHAIM